MKKASICFAVAVAVVCLASACARTSGGAAQPKQPASGPGGAAYKHADVKIYRVGSGNEEYWLFEPASPAPETAPVVAILHGWGGMNPQSYGAWIRHLVRRGNIVIYPRYQESLRTNPAAMTAAAAASIRDAFAQLRRPGHVHAEKGRFAAVGHSLGAVIALNLAAVADDENIPPLAAVMSAEPGDSKNSNVAKKFNLKNTQSILMDYSKVPADTLYISLAGDNDRMVGDETAKFLFSKTTAIPSKNKAFIIVHSDSHGSPPLDASHSFPPAPDNSLNVGYDSNSGPVRDFIKKKIAERRAENSEDMESRRHHMTDALDYYGTWRLFDALTDCAFYGKYCELALFDTPKARFMGKWSDGTPVKELTIVKK